MQQILYEIAAQNSLQLKEFQPLSGGDINEVFLLKCANDTIVVKLNDTQTFPGMFRTEAKGLQLLKASNSFKTPMVLATGEVNEHSYLLLEFIEKGTKTTNFWSLFAENLAKLHKTTQTNFGLEYDNYIGSLPQLNTTEKTSADFYIHQRLQPQFKLAREKGFKFEDQTACFKNISAEIPNEVPSLVHGDLWNGNYLVSSKGGPY